MEVAAAARTTSVRLVVVAAARRINNGNWLLDYCLEGVEILWWSHCSQWLRAMIVGKGAGVGEGV